MPVKHKLLGGRGSGKYLGFATQKVGRLAEEARGRAPSRTKRYTTDAGMVDIKVSIQDEQQYIKIKRRPCPSFLSGFCDLVFHFNEGTPTPVYQVDNPDPPPDTIPKLRRFYPSPATKAEDRTWRDSSILGRSEEVAQAMLIIKASMFSGEMRKVVQILQGQGAPVPYSPLFSTTHGVFKGTKGERWIIEASNQGLVAWVMGVCRSTPPVNAAGEQVLDYVPLPSPKPTGDALAAATAAGTYVMLLTAAEVQEFYNNSPFFSACGWAFNSDGHKIANVCIGSEDVYLKGLLYEISITESEGRPTAAVMTKIDEGILHGPKLAAHMKYPAGGKLSSFDVQYGNQIFIRFSDAPVFVYYDNDERIVARYRYDPNGGFTQTVTDPLANDDLATINCFPAADLNVLHRSGTLTYRSQPVILYPGRESAQSTLETSSYTESTYSLGDHLGIFYFEEVDKSYTFFDVWYLSQHRLSSVGRGESRKEVLIVPVYEREAFYWAQDTDTLTTVGTERFRTTGFVDAARSKTDRIEQCTATSSLAVKVRGNNLPTQQQCSVATFGQSYSLTWPGPESSFSFLLHYSITDEVKVRKQAGEIGGSLGGCDVISSIPHPTKDIVQNYNPAPVTTNAFIFEFVGSGGVRRAMAEPANKAELFRFIEVADQVAVAVRDAFAPATYVISPTVNLFAGSECISTAAAYPVAAAGNNMSFIGVP